ncbi:DUF2087 domain-containing protein [Salisediminibacterium selenitireducens]|uniref:Transcriptional regulator, LuxR family n=1 Tax=Bacillus selenitireducens (strain ATCC 700615 / DSM 15326 / MLS10) TaxID=439292 RepID=D6XZ54_BACIE|nr:DUF2087 domain-containing protein [Salisediminibacterium selenitireducens]ADI00339.1 transcriptional regulator, LuxR family [[Bacillus] selenitireducens MLS10]
MKDYMHIGISDLIRGYEEREDVFHCAFCPAGFEEGMIYTVSGRQMDAKRAVKEHIIEKHGSVLDVLLQEDKKETGLSDSQKEILRKMSEGKSDKDISREIGITPSTVRNHRFKLREKEKQAKLFLALMANLKIPKEGPDKLIPVHKGAKMMDERYAITEEEREKAVETYFIGGKEGSLRQFPSKEKRKIIILQTLLMRFDPDRVYTEREVNDILREAHDDFVTIRRYMIEYGLMTRSRDGSEYRLSGE